MFGFGFKKEYEALIVSVLLMVFICNFLGPKAYDYVIFLFSFSFDAMKWDFVDIVDHMYSLILFGFDHFFQFGAFLSSTCRSFFYG